ncbi:MAG: hypothetical protein HOC70_16345 [Gammaproteobacteria bacterium]|jgi:hypothetical protein|nr:hypothetical protein [Gammaproteobacteria bacterium]MBT4494816.1 hypothetical protein [Gammaproteobacteria bacterium]
MIRLLLSALFILSASTTVADEFTCRANNEVRTVSVDYEHKGWEVPCRVKYEKPSEGTVSYPWSAEATAGYCESKAEFLVGKLQNWGWVCTQEEPDESR